MPADKEILDRLQATVEAARDLLPPDADLRFRSMFGGRGVYAYDRMIGSLSHAGIAFKLAAGPRSQALELPGAVMLQYMPDRPASKDYVVLPPDTVDDPTALAPWVNQSIAYVLAQLPKPTRKKAS